MRTYTCAVIGDVQQGVFICAGHCPLSEEHSDEHERHVAVLPSPCGLQEASPDELSTQGLRVCDIVHRQ